jgi:hypothetical protein
MRTISLPTFWNSIKILQIFGDLPEGRNVGWKIIYKHNADYFTADFLEFNQNEFNQFSGIQPK